MNDLKGLRLVDHIGAINWERLHEYVHAAEALAEAVKSEPHASCWLCDLLSRYEDASKGGDVPVGPDQTALYERDQRMNERPASYTYIPTEPGIPKHG